eukprot:TRINITY_DN71393_c0_g1_i1.p1 TRINITY_DN71393_c0_g1~~TRINITY_DN71393_c0_g1_i1.p1  ORF type:complete len:270 (+),score=43.00 TRINITY_DN71393_c0_g1_i1:70-810(+)
MQDPKVLEAEEVGKTRFVVLKTLTYVDITGRHRKWDVASRTTRRGSCDAVGIVALLRRAGTPVTEAELLLVRQYRPAVDCFTLEFPAGLVDEGELPEVAALRELKEETGYVGKIVSCSPLSAMSPGMIDETMKIVVVQVDLDARENQHPEQDEHDKGFVTTQRVRLSQLSRTLVVNNSVDDCGNRGDLIFTGLQAFVEGFALGIGGASGDARSETRLANKCFHVASFVGTFVAGFALCYVVTRSRD